MEGLAGYIDLDHETEHSTAVLILERLALNEGNPKDYYTKPSSPSAPAPHTSIPHNLPTLQPFFGREAELQKIAEALDPASRTWGALIDGPGGMGKTSLAVRAAYEASPDDFKKIVFVSLKTRELDDDGVRDLSGFILSGLAELFGELSRLLGHEGILKAAEEQRPRLLLEALTGTQTLLLLDNLESLLKKERDTVFTFVKKLPAGCKAIITSRGRIGAAAEELILEKLSEAAALATLAELATHNPLLAATSEAERLVLYRETGGKPLLLRWTAGQIGRGNCLTFTDALHYIRSCPPGNDPLEFIFGDLVGDFSETETRVLCALTYFTLPAKVEHIAAIAGAEESRVGWASRPPVPASSPERTLDPVREAATQDASLGGQDAHPTREVDRALRSLVNRSLVVPSEELQTFALVPMVADFLRKTKQEVVAETGKQLEERACDLISENGKRNNAPFHTLENAWPIISSALPEIILGPNIRLQDVVSGLHHFLDFTGRWDDRLSLCEKAEASARQVRDFAIAGKRAYQMAKTYYRRRQVDKMQFWIERAEANWGRVAYPPGEETDCTRRKADLLRLRGLSHYLADDYHAAITESSAATALYRSISQDDADIPMALHALGQAKFKLKRFEDAKQDFSEALRIAKAADAPSAEANCKVSLAELALEQGEFPSAADWARSALPLADRLGRQHLIALTCYFLASALLRLGTAGEAIPFAKRAVEIFTRLRASDLEDARKTLRECEG